MNRPTTASVFDFVEAESEPAREITLIGNQDELRTFTKRIDYVVIIVLAAAVVNIIAGVLL